MALGSIIYISSFGDVAWLDGCCGVLECWGCLRKFRWGDVFFKFDFIILYRELEMCLEYKFFWEGFEIFSFFLLEV